MKVSRKPTVLLERFPYRYVQVGTLEINGKPDCRIQKVDSYTGRYREMFLLILRMMTKTRKVHNRTGGVEDLFKK